MTARSLTEAAFMRMVLDLARLRHWRVYHTFDSRRSHAGFPDLVLCRDRVLYAELKTDRGVVSPEQLRWLEALRLAGAEVHVWRPRDWIEIGRTLE